MTSPKKEPKSFEQIEPLEIMEDKKRSVSKDVQFMITCLCDTFYDQVAQSSVEVLEHVGCTVEIPDKQTCCGQPAFNAGDWKATRKVALHTCETFKSDKPIIIPSGSCAHMVQHGYSLAFEETPEAQKKIDAIQSKTWELCDFLVNGLGITSWPGKLNAQISLHRSCHTRGSLAYESAVTLLSSIEGVEILEFDEQEQCCGFGGTFSVAYPNTSVAMGKLKVEKLTQVKPDIIGTLDMACMLHLSGIADKEKIPFEKMHVAQILMQSLKNSQ